MSKSIKQYKDAMDNIKISDSFMKRTETLLKDIPAQKEHINPQPKWKVNKITFTAGAGLAACIIAVIALKTGLSNNDIENEASSNPNVSYTYYDSEITETETATEQVILRIEDDEINVEGIAAAADADSGSGRAADEENPSAYPKQETTTADAVSPQENAAPAAINNGDLSIANENSQTEVIAEGVSPDFIEPDPDIAEESVEAAPEAKLLYDINYDNSAIELQTYISELGSSSHALSSDTAQSIISSVADIVYSTPLTSTNTKFSSEFVLTVTDKATDEESFTIYLTKNQSIVITSHLKTGQSRKTYLLSSSDYTSIEKQLYLCFGSESDYEAFAALKSGK